MKEIKSFYPSFICGFREMEAVFTAAARLLEGAAAALCKLRDNQTVYKADEDALRNLEEFLGVSYAEERDELQRKKLVSSHFVGNGRFGVREIKEIAAVFISSPCNVSYADSLIHVDIVRDSENSFLPDDFYGVLDKRKPAHLLLNVSVSSPFFVNAYAGAAVSEYLTEILN